YKYLVTYRLGEIIFDLEEQFESTFLLGTEYRRLREQRFHAARSGKQCIAEGVGQSDTSKKGEIKMIGVAKGSYEELLMDNEDFLRQRDLPIWAKDDPRVLRFRQRARQLSHLSNLGYLGDLKVKPKLPADPETAGNLMLTLCHMETYLLSRQIESLEKKFIEEGGFTESLFQRRIEHRKSPKSLR
ncbi:four helix bundle protein, partial [Candidatus Roizmanbacteria bacterium]|nr:four helix bundle protein [Candidatus Roizmanbacteria bacterium]